MAMIDTSRTAPFGAITVYRVTTVLMNVAVAVKTFFVERLEAQRIADDLARLTPAQLSDIGMTQEDVISARVRAGLI